MPNNSMYLRITFFANKSRFRQYVVLILPLTFTSLQILFCSLFGSWDVFFFSETPPKHLQNKRHLVVLVFATSGLSRIDTEYRTNSAAKTVLNVFVFTFNHSGFVPV